MTQTWDFNEFLQGIEDICSWPEDSIEDIEQKISLLEEYKKGFMVMYTQFEWEPALELIESIMEFISCKIKENNIKLKKLQVPF